MNNGVRLRTQIFDLAPLIQALQDYLDGYDAWDNAGDYDAMEAAGMRVGLAQRDVPVHVINEYCRIDRRSFSPRSEFNVNDGERTFQLQHDVSIRLAHFL